MLATRHQTPEAFLSAAESLLMTAEAENNLILGVAQGLARNPSAAANPYLATVADGAEALACAVYIAPFKLVITRADREPIVALAHDLYRTVPDVEGMTGPDRSAADFVEAWSELSGVRPRLGMRLRIHETRSVAETGLPAPSGSVRKATSTDHDLLTG